MANAKSFKVWLGDTLKKMNHAKRIKLRARACRNGGHSLYLDMWSNQKRNYHYLSIMLTGKAQSEQEDREKLRLAGGIRDRQENEFMQRSNDFILHDDKSKTDVLEYINKKMTEGKRRAWGPLFWKVLQFSKHKPLPFKDVDRKAVEDFRTMLLRNYGSQNSARDIFNRFRSMLNMATREDIIKQSPAKGIFIEPIDTKREFLTQEDMATIIGTPFRNTQVRNAFLFACFTGLRWCDVARLRFDNIDGGYLVFCQQKTKGQERMKLHPNAVQIVEEQRTMMGDDGRLFSLSIHKNTLRWVDQWMKAAGIKKHITFHSARHTFATLCLTSGADIYTVSKLLGHRTVKTTQIYAKLIDQKKDDAIAMLPTF